MSTVGLPIAAAGPKAGQRRRSPLVQALAPLAVDVALPLAAYYAARGAGVPLVQSLIVSSVLPAVRTGYGLLRSGRLNAFAALILAVNAVGLLTTFLTGDPRLMIAKDGLVSSTIGIVILLSVRRGRPMMTEGLRPFLTKGDAAREAAFDGLRTGGAGSAGSAESANDSAAAAFRRAERGFSLVWGAALVLECAARVVGAYSLPLATMAWLPTVLLVGTIWAATVLTRPLSKRMWQLTGA
ncbi:VC0807 family protein [Kitasatospora sp. NPDC006697]|uniref:VC0807 family protein n=1 Tax=Kitasatospora sp. NPDC006697 TaxID=3364020 RepID=UPI0036CDED22